MSRSQNAEKSMIYELQEERSFLNSLLQSLPDMIWIKGADGIYLTCNHEFERFFGASESEIRGKTDYDFVDKPLADFFRQHDKDAMNSPTPLINEEWITYASDGRRVLLETTKTAIRNQQGKIIGVLGIGHDITLRHRQQQEIQLSENRLNEAQALAKIGSWEMCLVTHELYWSEETFNIFNLPSCTFKPSYESFLDIIHPDDRELVIEKFNDAIEQRETYFVSHRILVEGQVKYVEEKGHTEYSESGEPIRTVGTIQDVTDRVRYDNELTRLQNLVDYCADGILVIDAETSKIIDSNSAAHQVLGYSKDQMLKLHLWDFSQMMKTPEDWEAKLPEFIAKLSASCSPEPFEDVHIHKDGTLIPVEITARYIETPEANYFISTTRDIRDRKAAERVIKERTDRYNAVLAISKDGFWSVNSSTLCLEEVNDRYCELSGYSKEELIGKKVSELDAEDDPKTVNQRTQQTINEGGAIFESFHRRKDGSLWPVEVSISYYPTLSGRAFAFFRDITERKQAEDQMKHLAYHDMLTNLPNRQLLADRLQQARLVAERSDSLLAICYLDLDQFKPINDRYGHAMGDKLLIEVSRVLQEELRASDTLARLGGDEFVFLLTDLDSIYHCEEVIQRVLDHVVHPYEIEGKRLHISASIGITIYPHDSSSPDSLIRHADQAMYQAKAKGRNTYCMYDPIEDQKLHKYHKAIAELEHAIADSQLTLHYQPRIDLITGKLSSVEALVRWNHPDRGLLAPDEFLPLIEGNALEIALGEWVLKTALDQHVEWLNDGDIIPVSVNISPIHIKQANFPAFIKELLSAYPENTAHSLELEILETGAISSTAQVSAVMSACTNLGIKFSLDDFGTGYSSLTYFHKLPISILKIDRDFVRDMLDSPQDQDIVEGVIRLADAIGRPVVAEGVESLELGLILHQLGCRYAQGYGIAKPMPGQKLKGWYQEYLRDNSWCTLHEKAKDIVGPYDTTVAIFTHKHWLAQVKSYIRSNLSDPPPNLDSSHCTFSRWYNGIGRFRYGESPLYKELDDKHEEVHCFAESLVEIATSGDYETALTELDTLDRKGDELIALINKISSSSGKTLA